MNSRRLSRFRLGAIIAPLRLRAAAAIRCPSHIWANWPQTACAERRNSPSHARIQVARFLASIAAGSAIRAQGVWLNAGGLVFLARIPRSR